MKTSRSIKILLYSIPTVVITIWIGWLSWSTDFDKSSQNPSLKKLRAAPSLIVNSATTQSSEMTGDPLTVVRGIHGVNSRLVQWMDECERKLKAGASTNQVEAEELSEILASTNLHFSDLLAIARAMKAIHAALPIDQAAVVQARRELVGLSTDDPKALVIASGLREIGDMLWILKDYKTSEDLYALLLPFDPPHPIRWRTAAYSHAEMLYMQGHYQQALDGYKRLADIASPDMLADERADIDWSVGLMLFYLHHYHEAVSYFHSSAQAGKIYHTKGRTEFFIYALAKSGQVDQANREFDEYVRKYRPGVEDASQVLKIIDEATAAAKANDH